jgi:uncharacterized protein
MKHLLMIGQLLEATGPIDGRKKLQKIVHILQEGGVNFDLSYEFSFFGPYSAELKGSMDELVAAGLVAETTLPPSNGFRYEIKTKFVALLRRVESSANPFWSNVAVELSRRETRELEGVSTILFLESRGWSGADLENRFASLKPHLNESFAFFKELGHELKTRLSAAA